MNNKITEKFQAFFIRDKVISENVTADVIFSYSISHVFDNNTVQIHKFLFEFPNFNFFHVTISVPNIPYYKLLIAISQ